MSLRDIEAKIFRLSDLLEGLFIESGLKPSELKRTIERLSKNYNSGGFRPKDEREAIAYALYFLPEHLPKIIIVLEELFERFKKAIEDIEWVYDMGCGTGTGGIAVRLLDRIERPLTMIDTDQKMLNVAKRVVERLDGEGLKIIRTDYLKRDAVQNRTSLYIFMNTLSENLNKKDEILSFISEILSRNRGNIIVVIEPLSRSGSDVVRAIRKSFADYVIMPCPIRSECPVLKREGDICRFNIKQDLSIQLERVVNSGHRLAKFYYLVLSGSREENSESLYRVLEYPEERKYGFDMKVCSGSEVFNIKILIKASYEKRFIKQISPDSLIRISDDVREFSKGLSFDKIEPIYLSL